MNNDLVPAQGSKVGLNLQKFMQQAQIQPMEVPRANKKQDPKKKHKFDIAASEDDFVERRGSVKSFEPSNDLYLKNRARSERGTRAELSQTQGATRNFSVRAGLSSFIKESNIDIDALSAHLSQRKEKQKRADSRSKSDRSRKTLGSNNKPSGPGLPLPRSLAQSKRMAQQYRKGAASRKGKMPEEQTPEQKSRKELPRPVAQPEIFKQNGNIPRNEQTFENIKKYLQPEDGNSDRDNSSPNFANRLSPESKKQSQGRSRSKSGENVTQHDSGVLYQRTNKFKQDHDPTTSEKRKRYNSFSQGLGTTPDKDFQGRQIGMMNKQGIAQAPVGTIVRMNRPNKSIQPYSTFGNIKVNRPHVKSVSPMKQPNIGQIIQSSSLNMRQQASDLSQKAPGQILRQSNVGFNTSRNDSKASHRSNTLFSRGTDDNNTNHMEQQLFNLLPSSNTDLYQVSQPSLPQHHQSMMIEDQQQPEEPFTYTFEPIMFYTEPLYESIWDAFQLEPCELEQLLNTETLEPHYQEIRDDIERPLQTQVQNLSFDQLYSQSQLTIKKIRQGVKIQHKERLGLMTMELAHMKKRLTERTALGRATIKEAIAANKNKNQSLYQVQSLKHDILLDICSRLRQKIVMYGLQLRVFQKQEVLILFEEYWQNVYKQLLTKYYFHQMKKFILIKRRRAEVQSYAVSLCKSYKLQRIVNTWKRLRPARLLKEQRLQDIDSLIHESKLRKLLKSLKLSSLMSKLERQDHQLLYKYHRFKYCLKLFVHWAQAQRNLNLIKQQALGMMQKAPAPRQKEAAQPLSEADIEQQVGKCYLMLHDHKFSLLQHQRSQILAAIKRENATQSSLRVGFFEQTHQGELIQNNMPRPVQDQQTFKSLIQNQNPEGYNGAGQRDVMGLKYDIHSLLVDQQNYFIQEEQKQMARRAFFQPEAQQEPEDDAIQHELLPLPIRQQFSEQWRPLDRSDQQRAPNQLFAMLEKKAQRLQHPGKGGLASTRSTQGAMKVGGSRLLEIEHQKKALKQQVHLIRLKMQTIKKANGHQHHYSFAVKYLIKEEQQIQNTYRVEDDDDVSQSYTVTNTRRSQVRRSNLGQSYMESTPGDGGYQQYQEQEENFYPEDEYQQPEDSRIIQQQHQSHHMASTTQHGRNFAPGAAHLPTFSIASLQKDKYTMEDYVQFAQNAFQVDPDQPKPARTMLTRLHLAKQISILYTQWKLSYLEAFLERSLAQLRHLNLLLQTFSSLKSHKKNQIAKADNYYNTNELKKFYKLFEKWRYGNGQIVIKQNKIIKRFRAGIVFSKWVDFMNIQGDFLVMTLKAQKYHQQALSSKALLSLYTYYLKEAKVTAFKRRSVFLKFFKRIWAPKFERSKALRHALKRVGKKELEWERTRYQREFNYLMHAFQVWHQRVQEQQHLIKKHNALTHYRTQLLIKSFNFWKNKIRIQHGLDLLWCSVLARSYAPAFDQMRAYAIKTEIMHRDWLSYRQSYLKGQTIARWRELTCKQKLARMFFKKSVLLRFKNYVQQKRVLIPYQFWLRYRQIMFFKILKYLVHKKQKRQKKDDAAFSKMHAYQGKLIKKVYIALLENIYIQKKKSMIRQMVEEFRRHQLFERTFSIMKLAFLNEKKNTILKKVAHDFREDQLLQGLACVNPDVQTIELAKDVAPNDRILLQKVYTSWLQFTLDNFIKKKVVQRYQLYLSQKLVHKAFQALRHPQAANMTPSRPEVAKPSMSKQVVFEGEAPGQPITPNSILKVKNKSRVPETQPSQRQGSFGSEAYLQSSNYQMGVRQSQESIISNRNLSTSQYDRQYSASSAVKFVETTGKKTRNMPDAMGVGEGFGTSEFHNPNSQTPDASSSQKQVDSQYSYEQTPMVRSASPEARIVPQHGNTTYGTNDTHMLHKNQKLFSELEAIFDKNRMWMEEQKDKQKVIQELADQYQDQILMHDNSRMTMSNVTRSRVEEQESVLEELASIRRRQSARQQEMQNRSERMSQGQSEDYSSYIQTQQQTPHQDHDMSQSFIQSSIRRSGFGEDTRQSPLRMKQAALEKMERSLAHQGRSRTDDLDVESSGASLSHYMKSEDELAVSLGDSKSPITFPRQHEFQGSHQPYTAIRQRIDESSFVFGTTKNLMSGSGATSGADLVYSGKTGDRQMDRDGLLTFSNTKMQEYQAQHQQDLDHSCTTDEQIEAMRQGHPHQRSNLSLNKSNVSIGSFSNLAKELQRERD